MGVVKQQKNKTKKEDVKKDLANGKSKDVGKKVKKKKFVSCLQCIKPGKEDGGLEGKYRVAAPELMQDTFMSDSEDEGGEVECPIQQQQQYRYMNSEAGTLHRAKPLEDTVTDGHLWPSNNDRKVATIDRQPLDIGFLVSFVVDARGGAMKAKRRGGVRIIVPAAACAAPTRVTCRAATRRAPAAAPPPLMEGEALASRLLELQPQGAKFLAPVVIEVPIFTSSCREREIVILRSDTGETWQDHYLHNNDNPLIQEALQRERQEYGGNETVGENGERVTRIITCDFPHYLACVSRVRQEVHIIGPEGGTISSAHIPQVQAQFPAAALTKRIRVGLQAHAAGADLCRRVLPRHAAVSPVLTVEPRRRKFHRSITLTAPLPAIHGGTEKPSTSNLRLLCSIMGGQARAVWEDVTGSTPLTVTDDCASFTTTVSARFWMMSCQNVSDATKLATELYREMLLVPFEVRIVVLGKRLDALEGRLLVMYITDRYAYETLLQQEHYTEVAHSTSVRFLDGKDVFLEFSGNLVPVTKSGSQPMLTFEAFKDNRVEFTVRVKHHEENPSGRIYFMNEPKVPKGEQSQTPACVLDVELPERIAPRAGKSQVDYLNLDQSGFDALKDELSFHWGGDHNNSIGPASLPYAHDRQLNGHTDKIITNGDVKYPTKETEDSKDTKPQVNGDTLHVDSNKTKATFDSDEDKTPMNTLEKGKKKPEGGVGFLGGLADKVKNVFGHSEDKEEEKETSPKPQPKPRESKEKSPEKSKEKSPEKTKEKSPEKTKDSKEKSPDKTPPKPAPRLINEDLLGKVDDMFKDLKTKPHLKEDDDISSQVYSTKLVVDEENAKPVEENLYQQYELMQPVDTPLCNQKTDPFSFYVGCCEGKYKKGQKHRHDETSNLVDRIETVHFAAHEIGDKVHGDLSEGLCIVEEEKDKIKQKTGAVADDLIADYEKAKSGAQDKVHEFEDGARGKLNDIAESAEKVKDDVNNKANNLKSNISTEVDDAKSAANDTVDNLVHQAGVVKDDINSKAMALNFAAMEIAEEMKLRGSEKVNQVGNATENAANNVKHKAQDGVTAVSEAVHDAKENLSNKAQDAKANAKESLDNAKATANEKLQSMGDSIEGVKEKSKKELKKEAKEAKKKAKEGKNFFTGLVSNIFGEKEKLEDEAKNKLAEGKDAANKALDKASAKKDELQDAVAKKQDELKDGAEQLAQSIDDKKKQAEKAAQDKKNELEKSIQDKTAEAKQAVESKAGEIKSSVQITVSEVKDAVDDTAAAAQEKAHETKDAIKNKASEVGNAIHDTASEVGQAVQDKTSQAKDAVVEKSKQVKDSIQDTATEVGSAIHDKTVTFKDNVTEEASKLGDAIQDKTTEAKNKASEVGQTINDEANKFGQTLQEKTSEAKDKASEFGHSIQDGASQVGQSIQGKASEAKDKASEFGNAIHDKFTGFGSAVHETASNVGNNIHDTANNVGQSIQEKTSEAKDKASELGHNIQDKTSEAKDAIHDKAEKISEEVHEKSHGFGHAIADTFSGIGHAISDTFSFGHHHDKVEEAKDSVAEKVTEVKDTVESKASDLKDAAQGKATEVKEVLHDSEIVFGKAIQSKTDEFGQAIHDTKDSAKSELDRIRHEAEITTEQISKSAEDAINAASNKKGEIQTSLNNKFDDIKQSGKEEFEYLQQSATDKASDLQRSSKQAFDHVQDSTLSTFDKVESSAKDKVSDAKDKWDEMQSSTIDTFASMRDDVHSLGSSAEDTLHSFQSSAGNTFDSLDDSAKLVLSDTQQNVEEGSKQLFGDAKGYFEGFQVSADNKLEEIKGVGKDGVEAVGDRLGEAAEGVREAEHAALDAVNREADTFTNSLNNLGSSVFGSSGKGFMKDSSTKLMDAEKSQSSPSPHKKSSGIPKLKRKK